MTGGTLPLGPVTENVSVRHWVARVTPVPPLPITVPWVMPVVDVVRVVGPAITKELKSNRS